MNALSRLRELSASSAAQLKELGLLTKNTAAYDKDGTFTGVENHYNGPGIAEAAAGAAVAGAGLGAGHVGIMKKYGTETVRREKGRFIKPKQVTRTTGEAYKAAGNDALGALKRVVGKRFSANERLKELAGGYAMKEGDSSTIYKEPGIKGHLKRHAGLYISAPLALPSLGIAPLIGATVDSMRSGGNILKTHIDSVNPLVAKLPKHVNARASHKIYDGGDGSMAYIPLSSHARLKELSSKALSLKELDQRPEDDQFHPVKDAALIGAGAGGVLAHQGIMKKYGTGAPGFKGIGQAYGNFGNDVKAGFTQGFNPPSTSAGSGMQATAATNSPLGHDTAKFSGTAPGVDAAHGVGGTAKVVEAAEEAPKFGFRAGAAAGGLGSKIKALLGGLRRVV